MQANKSQEKMGFQYHNYFPFWKYDVLICVVNYVLVNNLHLILFTAKGKIVLTHFGVHMPTRTNTQEHHLLTTRQDCMTLQPSDPSWWIL